MAKKSVLLYYICRQLDFDESIKIFRFLVFVYKEGFDLDGFDLDRVSPVDKKTHNQLAL